jgi:hypothetical protein
MARPSWIVSEVDEALWGEATAYGVLKSSARMPSVWIGRGRYALHVVKCPQELVRLDKDYNSLAKHERGVHAEMLSLM